ncbi:MAG: hypothetical protein M0R80_02660 [Proteobacteria bacterium]|jgi:hypothetical protein|nr:hypothetical protein [Pseudomonadota bacterium]
MVILENAKYEMELGCGMDVWRLSGQVYGHPNFEDGKSVFVSTPKVFDEETNELTTSSGRQYVIQSYVNRTKVIEQIKQDIEKKGFEAH